MVQSLGMGGVVEGQQALANQLSYLLPFHLKEKLQLLALADPDERLGFLQGLLDQLQGESIA
ncbi:hypothetical protein D3C78_1813140 [compost metagenome]